MRSADNSSIQECGKALFALEVVDIQLQHEVIVAKIADEGLLGMDILQNGPGGPADILLSQGVIKWKGHEIQGFQVGMPRRILRVWATEDYHVSSESESVIKAKIDVDAEDKNMCGDYVIEPSATFVD